jgi:hypothetical protein
LLLNVKRQIFHEKSRGEEQVQQQGASKLLTTTATSMERLVGTDNLDFCAGYNDITHLLYL